jgi:hypothetical protein
MRVLRAHDAHMQLLWKCKIVDKTPPSPQKRLVLQPRNGAADDFAFAFGVGKTVHMERSAMIVRNFAVLRRSMTYNAAKSRIFRGLGGGLGPDR